MKSISQEYQDHKVFYDDFLKDWRRKTLSLWAVSGFIGNVLFFIGGIFLFLLNISFEGFIECLICWIFGTIGFIAVYFIIKKAKKEFYLTYNNDKGDKK
ncbi:MAG: hypothetical protein LBT30_03265 [Clostridiales bacterium]|jgi:hypothetical protein|nr:hypothetical protein [Clostridiales bacterium]